jgi:hypothetical protein
MRLFRSAFYPGVFSPRQFFQPSERLFSPPVRPECAIKFGVILLKDFGKESKAETIVPRVNQDALAQMVGTTRSHPMASRTLTKITSTPTCWHSIRFDRIAGAAWLMARRHGPVRVGRPISTIRHRDRPVRSTHRANAREQMTKTTSAKSTLAK